MKTFLALVAVGLAFGSVSAQTPAPVAYSVDGTPSRGFQGDPADSLYRVAHDLLARGEYGRSAQLFREIGEKYPKSRYAEELPYNEAFARYRIGTTRELESASRLLEPRAKKLLGTVAASRSPSDERRFGRTREGDVVGLYIRVNRVLAQRGNSDAANVVKGAAQSNANSCDGEDVDFNLEAISALSQMDLAQALPIIKHVLNKPNDCNVELRRRALFVLGRSGDAEAATILASTAKNDPSPAVRAAAVNWLPKLMGDAGVTALEDVLRTEQDDRIQTAAVRTLASSDNPRARKAIRAFIDRKDVPLNLRREAIRSITIGRATTDDAAYLRELYARADNDELKQAIVGAASRIPGKETEDWILSIAKNPNEPSAVRGDAIGVVMRSGTVAGWIALYDAAQSFDVRSRIVTALENRKEAEAADKLVDIAKTSTVPSLRLQAIRALTRRKDARVPQLLDEIMNGRRP
jgi:HEAT repeat protein